MVGPRSARFASKKLSRLPEHAIDHTARAKLERHGNPQPPRIGGQRHGTSPAHHSASSDQAATTRANSGGI